MPRIDPKVLTHWVPVGWFNYEMRGWGLFWFDHEFCSSNFYVKREKSQERVNFKGRLLHIFVISGIEFGQQTEERNYILCLLKWLIWVCKARFSISSASIQHASSFSTLSLEAPYLFGIILKAHFFSFFLFLLQVLTVPTIHLWNQNIWVSVLLK